MTEQQRSVQLQVLPATALRNSGDTELVNKVRIMAFMKFHRGIMLILLILPRWAWSVSSS